MSDSNKKDLNDGFTIQINLTNDSSEIPGIAELLGKKTSTKTSSIREIKDTKTTDSISGKTTSLKSLRDFETHLEIHFERKKESYVFFQSNQTGSKSYMGMDDLLKGMIIPQSYTENAFQESNQEQNKFWFEVLGVENETWIQLVKSQNSKLLTILISGKGMASKSKDVIEYCETTYSSILSSGSIELDVA